MKEDNNVMMETTKLMIHFLVQNNRISTILHAKQRLWRININDYCKTRDKWVPVTRALRVLRLRMEERPPIWRVAANILNKQSRTADEGWSSSLGVGRGANNASPWKPFVKKYSQGEMFPLETKQSGGKLLPHSDLRRVVFLEEVSRSSKREILLGTWNVRSLYRAGSLIGEPQM